MTEIDAGPQVLPAPAAPRMLRLSAGFVYFYFGFLKFYTDLSPAELLATQTIMRIWPWHVDAHTVLFWLALSESVIGLAFLLNIGLRYVLWIFLLHQLGTFLPLVLYPELCFKIAPFSPTMEGQYILKNLISLSAGLTVMMPAVRARTAREKAEKQQRIAARRPNASNTSAPAPRETAVALESTPVRLP